MQSSSVEQLCFGSGPNQLNLKVVQQRVDDLIRVLDALMMELWTYTSHWENLLDKLNVVNMNYMQIMAELRALLRQYIIYPKYTDNQSVEDNIPGWLASRLLDDQISQEQQWLDEMPGGLQQLLAQPGESVKAAEEQVSELQDLIGWLTNISHTLKSEDAEQFQQQAGVLDSKGKERQQIDRMSREIKAAAETAEAARQQAGAVTSTVAHTAVVVGLKRGRTGQAALAEAAAALNVRSEEDVLIAKIFNGELFAEKEKQTQPQPQQQPQQQPPNR
eukprot:GHUV01006906.1.p1 GENE.GHUV01006906.1~~GHUV01006906.1.p1  ORF type:complete len:275 (+),score=113.20 GHUV01006906.1:200-1024(+)